MALDQFLHLAERDLRERGSKKWTAYPDCLGAFVAEMDFGAAPCIIQSLTAAIQNQSFGYLPAAVSQNMSQSCAGWYKESFGWAVQPEWIYPGPDVLGLLQYTLEFLSDQDKPILVLTPTYAPFLPIAAATGRQVVEIPLAADGLQYALDFDALEAAYARYGGGLLLLTNPHNPLGRVFTKAELLQLSAIVDRYNGRVFADEIHAPIVYSGSRHVPYASISDEAANHSVTAVSASKGWNLAGLKCAQIILTSAADREEWTRSGYLTMHAASILGVVANTAAYESGGKWLSDVLNVLEDTRSRLQYWMQDMLPEIGFRAPEGTYLAWLDCRELGLESPAAFFRERGRVALVEGKDCGLGGEGFVRLNFAMPQPLVKEAVERMRLALDSR
ncbi:MalY/PatB family protein [Pseudarthrobacter sp. YAF2]|uniref:MalY/PatB family protein n=1 Tax=Pseudarthrobacter sp. YAF2 TaxID=3233078 RepID=UPI003F9C3077